MQTPHLGTDECLDPALMSVYEDGAVDPFGPSYADADAGPPSPFDMSTIDPDLLALYPEHKDNSISDSAAVEAPERSQSPQPQEEPSAIPGSPTADTTVAIPEISTHGESRPKKRVRFAPLPPHDSPAPAPKPQVSRRVERRTTRAHPLRRVSGPLPKKHSALGVAKRTISDGTLVPPSGPCARCEWEEEECLIKYPGAACNVCRRRGRKCELVDESVKYNGQRAKDLMRADGSGCVGVV